MGVCASPSQFSEYRLTQLTGETHSTFAPNRTNPRYAVKYAIKAKKPPVTNPARLFMAMLEAKSSIPMNMHTNHIIKRLMATAYKGAIASSHASDRERTMLYSTATPDCMAMVYKTGPQAFSNEMDGSSAKTVERKVHRVNSKEAVAI